MLSLNFKVWRAKLLSLFIFLVLHYDVALWVFFSVTGKIACCLDWYFLFTQGMQLLLLLLFTAIFFMMWFVQFTKQHHTCYCLNAYWSLSTTQKRGSVQKYELTYVMRHIWKIFTNKSSLKGRCNIFPSNIKWPHCRSLYPHKLFSAKVFWICCISRVTGICGRLQALSLPFGPYDYAESYAAAEGEW